MLERILRLLAIAASLLVLAGWGLFAIDESSAASRQSAEETAGREATQTADPSPDQERAREKVHSRVREAIDDAGDVLLAPFAPVVAGSGSQWVRRSIPALLALIVYGFGLGFLARLLHRGG